MQQRGPLRFPRLWLTIGWLLVGVVVFLSLSPEPPEVGLNQGDKLGHIAAWGTLMLWFANIYARGPRRLWLCAGFFTMGVCLEVLQGTGGERTFQYADMLANGFGILAGWSLAKTRFGNTLLQLDRWLLRIREEFI